MTRRVVAQSFGGPEVLALQDIELGTPGDGQALVDVPEQLVGVSGGAYHLVPGALQQVCQSLPQQGLVLPDHDAHGSSATTRVPRSDGLISSSRPPSVSTRSVSPPRPDPART